MRTLCTKPQFCNRISVHFFCVRRSDLFWPHCAIGGSNKATFTHNRQPEFQSGLWCRYRHNELALVVDQRYHAPIVRHHAQLHVLWTSEATDIHNHSCRVWIFADSSYLTLTQTEMCNSQDIKHNDEIAFRNGLRQPELTGFWYPFSTMMGEFRHWTRKRKGNGSVFNLACEQLGRCEKY